MMEIVYFIQSGDFIKVGRTTNLRARIAQIQTGNPQKVEVIGALYGGPEIERALHSELRAFSVNGEWFKNDEMVRRVIDRIIDKSGSRGDEAFGLIDNKRGATIDEGAFVRIAQSFLDRIINSYCRTGMSKGEALITASSSIGVPYRVLWSLKYRPPRVISHGNFLAIKAAIELIDSLEGSSSRNLSDAKALVASTNESLTGE